MVISPKRALSSHERHDRVLVARLAMTIATA